VTGLTSKGGTTTDYESLIRFDVTGLTGDVVSAKLYLYAYEGTSNGPKIYKTRNSWSETGVTWANRPSSSGGAYADSAGIPARTWFTLDVTRALTGDGTYSFILRSTSADALSIYSREASNRQPRLVIVTEGNGQDETAPSVPAGLSATPFSSDAVRLSWSGSSDDVGIAGYDIFRDGKQLSSVSGTSFTDSSVTGDKTYSYQVRARDAAGNRSELSAVVDAVTPSQTTTIVVTPSADARVVESSPTSNYRSSSELRAEGGSDPDIVSFIRFEVPPLEGDVFRVTLRLFVPAKNGAGTNDAPAVYLVNSGWQEGAVTWNNQPSRVANAIGDAGSVGTGVWLEYDLVMAPAGGRSFSIGLYSTSTDVVLFSSREGANPPQLIITTSNGTGAASVPEAPIVEEPSPTPTATATATPTPTATPESALPFGDGFESGDLSAWSAADGFTVIDTIARDGSRSGLARSSGAAEAPDAASNVTRSLDEGVAALFVKSAVYVDRRGDGVDLINVRDDRGRPLATFSVTGDGRLAYRNERTGEIAILSEFTSDEWHELQVHVVTGQSGQIEVWLDGRLIARNAESLFDRAIAAVSIGDGHTDRSFTVAFDNVAFDRTCLGECSTELVPSEPEPTPVATETAPAATPAPDPQETPVTEPTATPTPEPEPTQEPTVAPTETPVPTPEGPVVDDESSDEDA
jgi:hypothetical protein